MPRGRLESVELVRRESARLLGELAVTLRDPSGGVCPPAERHPVVADRDVRMMVLRFGEVADAIHERERLDKVAELELSLERVVDLAPSIGGHNVSIYDRRSA